MSAARAVGTPPPTLTPPPVAAQPAPVQRPSQPAIGQRAPAELRARARIADDVIESGEIVERRSLVIRSQKVPVVDWNDAPTEVTARPLPLPLPPPPVQPARRAAVWHFGVLAGAIVFGLAAIVLTVRAQPDSDHIDALKDRAEVLATSLDGDARAAMVRAEAIATSPVLRAAIVTDASTLADMARDRDVVFPLQKGDVIEVYQVRGGKRTLMLRMPESARPLDPPAGGQSRIDGAGDRLAVVANAVVVNSRSDVTGEIVVSTPVELAPLAAHIGQHATGAQLVGTKHPVVVVPSKDAPNVTIPIATKTPALAPLTLAAVVPVPAASSVGPWVCMTFAAGLLAAFVILHRRSRRQVA
jgi:hypothetical protein